MHPFFIYLFATLGVAAVVAFIFTGLKLVASSKRISRSIDPIAQKSKNLKLEVSALKRSRLDRQRRLDTSGSHDPKPTK